MTRCTAAPQTSGVRVNGYALVFAAAVGFGTLGMFSRLFYDEGGEPFSLLFLRFAVTGPALLLLALARGERPPAPGVTLAGLALGVFQFGAAYSLLEGFARAPVGLVVLLSYVYPLLVAAGAILLLREEFGLVKRLVLAMGMAGIVLTVGLPGTAPAVGIALGLLAGVCIASSILCAKALMTRYAVTPVFLTALMFLGPAVGLSAAALVRGVDIGVSGPGWAAAAGAVVLAAILPIAFFYTGVRLIGAGTAALIGIMEPLVAVLLAYAVLDESLSAIQLVGGALIVTAVAGLGLQALRPRPARGAP